MTTVTPLRDRIAAPADVSLPSNGDGITWRPATMADVPAILECDLAIGEADHPHFRSTLEELEEEFTHSWVEPGHDSLVALDGTGVVVAWGLVMLVQGQETAVRCLLIGGVRPSHRGQGIGRALLSWQESRGLQMLGASDAPLPGFLVLWAESRNTSLSALAEHAGFQIARHYLELHRDLSQPIEPRTLDGYEIVPFDLALSEQVRQARNDSFRDHWGSQPTVEEAWNTNIRRSNKRHDLSFLAIAPDGEVAGFVMTEVNTDDFEAAGFSHAYINLVGARRTHRGRGIARALLTRTLEACRDAGLEKTVLDVDSESPTGATALYEQVGYTVSDRSAELNRQF